MPTEDLTATSPWLTIREELPGKSPEQAYSYWTEPEKLCSWWPKIAELDVKVGGAYHLSWPQQDWHLRGTYTAVEPGKKLEFTWTWDHDPAKVERTVEVQFEPSPDGSLITVRHGQYGDTEGEAAERNGHFEGWQHFLSELRMVKCEVASEQSSEAPKTASISKLMTENEVIEALQKVYDPEIPVDIYELGLVYDIHIGDDGTVGIRMTLTSPACPAAGQIPIDVEQRVRAIDGVKDVIVEIIWDPPWTPDRMSEAAKLELGFF